MVCPSCKHENRAGRKFCVHCGAGLELDLPLVRRQRLGTRRAVLRRVREATGRGGAGTDVA